MTVHTVVETSGGSGIGWRLTDEHAPKEHR